MTVPSGPVPSFSRGVGLQSGDALQKLAQLIGGTQNNITAQADGTKANATQITACKAHVATSAGAGDSVLLPPGYPGLEVTIFNGGASSIQVFGAGLDTINDIVTGTGVTQNNGISAVYTCYDVVAGVGIWGRVLSA
jgi:hypothetical protein